MPIKKKHLLTHVEDEGTHSSYIPGEMKLLRMCNGSL